MKINIVVASECGRGGKKGFSTLFDPRVLSVTACVELFSTEGIALQKYF